jgi:hypothetical protein
LTDYKFTLDFVPGQFTITVKEGNTIIESVTINDNTYTSGKFGFYNYSQSNVLYSGFSQQALQVYNYAYDVHAIDPDQDKLTYSLSNKPSGMVINPDTGKLEFARHDERMKPQTNNPNRELELDISTQDWYAYSENYGTSEEKKFIRFMETKMDSLRKQYSGCEIFLVRNELEYWMFGLSNGKRFSPDYLMFIHDTGTRKLYYQCVFEVK